jgi:ribosome recycling factor
MEFSKLQTGRANAALVEHVMVEAYGQKQELRAVAGVSIPEARTIVVQPWDKSIMGNVEKALQQLDLGGSPVNDGVVIRINLPPMTEERRSQLTKVVGKLAEEARISVRKHRQDTQDAIKQEKEEDVRETLLAELQKAVDDANASIANAASKKDEEVMKV